MKLHERRAAYEHHRETSGMTVEEWEVACGLPPFSTYPVARGARHPSSDGFFMYSPALKEAAFKEEDRQMTCLLLMGFSYREVGALFSCSMMRVYNRLPGIGSTKGGPRIYRHDHVSRRAMRDQRCGS